MSGGMHLTQDNGKLVSWGKSVVELWEISPSCRGVESRSVHRGRAHRIGTGARKSAE